MTQIKQPEGNRNKSSQEIETEIGQTRSDISDDIKALSDKMNRNQIKQQAKQALGDAADSAMHTAVDKAVEIKDVAVDKIVELKDAAMETAVDAKAVASEKLHEAADTVVEAVDEVAGQTRRAGRAVWRFSATNAVPLTLIGVGASWLIVNGRSARSERAALPAGVSAERSGDGRAPTRHSSTHTSAHTAGGNGSGTRASSATRDVAPGLGDRAQRLYGRAGDSLNSVEDAIAGTATRSRAAVQDQVVRARDASRQLAQENPMMLVFGSLVAGIGLGLLLPTTARESRLIEPAREKIRHAMGDAREAAQDVGSMAKETAKTAVQALR